jgi:hypothetical protein
MQISNFTYCSLICAAVLLSAVLAPPALAAEKLYQADALIVPMDTTYQDYGMLEAYGLVYELLLSGVPVDWTISPGKDYGEVDFYATAEDLQTLLLVDNHGYRGGPFVVESAYYDQALPVVQAWQVDHPLVSVHRATVSFAATAAREMLTASSIAVFADRREEIAFEYLNAAAIPMSNGDPWPAKRDKTSQYPCPGNSCCPDCFDEIETAGPTTSSHTDGALFDANATPRYCQFMSMHYKHPAPTPEVVAEVREFLQHQVHFLAECQAVNAFENEPSGHFLTGNGLVAGNGSNNVDYHQSDDPFSQADGGYENPGGSEPAFSLDAGSFYHAANVVMVSSQGTALGADDIWMNGHVDGDPDKGKVSYLGGHKYTTGVPISANPGSQGTRYFLNSLFEAPCSSAVGQPNVSTWVNGPGGTNSSVESVSVCYENTGPGIAFDSVLTLTLPAGTSFVSATGGGVPAADTVTWTLGSLAADAADCFDVTVSFGWEGSFGFSSSLAYEVGLNPDQVDSGPPVYVRFGHVNLLRYGGVVQIDPQIPANSLIFVAKSPGDPALDPSRDMEVVAFQSGAAFPHDVADLLPGSPPLVYYEVEGEPANTLRVQKTGNKIVVTY